MLEFRNVEAVDPDDLILGDVMKRLLIVAVGNGWRRLSAVQAERSSLDSPADSLGQFIEVEGV